MFVYVFTASATFVYTLFRVGGLCCVCRSKIHHTQHITSTYMSTLSVCVCVCVFSYNATMSVFAHTDIAGFDIRVSSACPVDHCRVQSLQSLAVQEASEAGKPLVERELAILSAFCHHIYPTLQEGEQHPVSNTLPSYPIFTESFSVFY